MNSPVTRPERTLKEKQLFKLTGEILGTEMGMSMRSAVPSEDGGGDKWEQREGKGISRRSFLGSGKQGGG